MRFLFILLLGLALGACSTTRRIPLTYSPSDAALAQGARTFSVSMGRVEDLRPDPDAPLGTVQSGLGRSNKEIKTLQPLTAVVREFFQDALEQRGSYSSKSSEQIQVDILGFEANQLIRREASIDLLVTLHDARTGYNRAAVPVRIHRMQGGLLNADNLVVGNIPAFQRFVSKTLSEAADTGIERVLQ